MPVAGPACCTPAAAAGRPVGGSGAGGSGGSTGRSRCAPRSPARRSRTRRDSECGVSGWQRERQRAPLVDRRQQRHRQGRRRPAPAGVRQTCGDRLVTSGGGLQRPATLGGGDLGDHHVQDLAATGRPRTARTAGRRRPDEASTSPAGVRDRRGAVGHGDVAGGQRGQVPGTAPRPVGTAPAGSGPAGRTCPASSRGLGSAAERRLDRGRGLRPGPGVVRRWAGPARPAPRPTRPGGRMPGRGVVVVDGGDPAPLGRRRGRAVGQERDDGGRVGGQRPVAGGGAPVGEQRPVRGVGRAGSARDSTRGSVVRWRS